MTVPSYAQVIDQVSVSAGYSMQTFYDIESGETKSIESDIWDVSFSVTGFQDAAISINEGSPSMGVELELYYMRNFDFDSEIVEEDLIERIYNDESSWSVGAFNSIKDTMDFADFGWGKYNPATMSVSGDKLFIIKLKNGQLKRIFIESLIGTTYTFSYSDFDGSNVKTITIDKSDYSNKQRVFFSFQTESVLDLEPQNWDLFFTRYSSPVDDGQGNILNYVVTGVLSAEGVRISEANGINPISVSESDFANDYISDSDAIGFDWKEIDIATFQWSLILDRVYFVKTLEGNTYKLFFFDFEGSSTGVTTLEKTEIFSTANKNIIDNSELSLFPNPNNGHFNITTDSMIENDATITIYSLTGKKVLQQAFSQTQGLKTLTISTNIGPGTYMIKLQSGNRVIVEKFVVK